MTPLAIVSLIVQLLPAVSAIVTTSTTNEDLTAKIKDLSKPLADLMGSIGAALFPKAAPALHIVGGIMASFDPNLVKWLQGSLNTLSNAGLQVDGIYGPATRQAVSDFQQKYNLRVDGLAGQITQAAISALLAKLPSLAPKPAA
jgi:hypothetical protein